MNDPGPNMELRALLAVLLSLGVMLAFQYLYAPTPEAPTGEERVAAESPPGSGATEDGPVGSADGGGSGAAVDAVGPERGGRPAPEAGRSSGGQGASGGSGDNVAGHGSGDPDPPGGDRELAGRVVEAAEERDVLVETDRMSARITNRGGRLRSVILEQYESDTGETLQLVDETFARAGYLPLDLHVPGSAELSERLNRALFDVETVGGEAVSGGRRALPGDPVTVRLRWSDGEGTWVEKVLEFDATSDLHRLRVRAGFPEVAAAYVATGPGLGGGSASGATRYLTAGALILANEELEHWTADDLEEAQRFTGEIRWIGQESNYFLSLLVPDGPAEARMFVETLPPPATGASTAADQGEEEEEPLRQPRSALAIPPGGLDVPLYLGPKDYARLGELGHGLQQAVDFGMFSILAIPLYKALQWTQSYVTNYGLAIVVLTILIKILFLPLTQKSYVSMQKMRSLKPQMDAIKSKYDKKDMETRQKMNQEVMELYKKEGVSPIGGCLPMLLQIPVLFAFYAVLSVAIELRHAPFILWIGDLSKHDPYYVLPILMGVSMYVQQNVSASPSADPTQARMFKLMPVFMTVIFIGLPAGLVLYWFVNNLLGIAQQTYIQKRVLSDAS